MEGTKMESMHDLSKDNQSSKKTPLDTRGCWVCREEPQPSGAQILERCDSHIWKAIQKAMGLGETRAHPDSLPMVDEQC